MGSPRGDRKQFSIYQQSCCVYPRLTEMRLLWLLRFLRPVAEDSNLDAPADTGSGPDFEAVSLDCPVPAVPPRLCRCFRGREEREPRVTLFVKKEGEESEVASPFLAPGDKRRGRQEDSDRSFRL